MGSTIITLLHEKINPKNGQVASLLVMEEGFLQLVRVVSSDYIDYGKPN